jgi:aspartokinase
MATTSLLVQQHVRERPLLQEALIEGIVSYANLAEKLHPHIERMLNKKVKHSAIVMALRRYSETLQRAERTTTRLKHELVIKTSLCDIAVQKTASLMEKLRHIDRLVRYDKGDSLNIVHGNYETSIVVNQKYQKEILERLSGEQIIAVRGSLVAVAMTFSAKFYDTPGIVAKYTRALAWENINVIEIVSTYTELAFIIAEHDLTKAYEVLSAP